MGSCWQRRIRMTETNGPRRKNAVNPEAKARLEQMKDDLGYATLEHPFVVFINALFDVGELKVKVLRGKLIPGDVMLAVHEMLTSLSPEADETAHNMMVNSIDMEAEKRGYNIGRYGIDYDIERIEVDDDGNPVKTSGEDGE
jgi:hypothetical protein